MGRVGDRIIMRAKSRKGKVIESNRTYFNGPYKRTQVANLRQAKFCLPQQAAAPRYTSNSRQGSRIIGLVCEKLGLTYTVDRLRPDSSEITSAIDHIYVSQILSSCVSL